MKYEIVVAMTIGSLVFLLFVVLFAIATGGAQDDCQRHGGHIVVIHSNGFVVGQNGVSPTYTTSWFCEGADQ